MKNNKDIEKYIYVCIVYRSRKKYGGVVTMGGVSCVSMDVSEKRIIFKYRPQVSLRF